MAVFKQLLDFYLKSSLHVALAVFAFTKVAQLCLNITYNNNYEVLVFCATDLAYNFLKYGHLNWQKTEIITKNKFLILVNLCVSFGFVFVFLAQSFNVKLGVLIIGFLVLFYFWLRKFWLTKLISVAICICGFVLLPFIEIENISRFELLLFTTKLFLLILVLLLPVEIYDANFDDLKLKTIVQKFGDQKTKVFGFLILFLFFLLNLMSKFSISNSLICLISGLFLLKSNKNNSKYLTSFWLESLPILWWILCLLIN